MRIRHAVIPCTLVCIALLPAAASVQSLKPEMLAQFDQKTGLKPVEIPGTQGAYMGKTHRGYNVVFTAKAGNVWGRYAARLTIGEIGREVGGFTAYLTGQGGRIGESVVDSPLDRLLSQYLGQPVTLAIVLTHKKPNAPRLDVLSDLVEAYKAEMVPMRPVGDAELLNFLIEQKSVTQAGAASGAGIAASTISAVLAGMRKLNRAQITKLERFTV